MSAEDADMGNVAEAKAPPVVIDLTAGEDEIKEAQQRLADQENQIAARLNEQDQEEQRLIVQEEVEEKNEFALEEQKMRNDHQEAVNQAMREFEGQHVEAIRASNNPNDPRHQEAVRFLEEKKKEWDAIQALANLTFEQRLKLRKQEFDERMALKKDQWKQKMDKEAQRRQDLQTEWLKAKAEWEQKNREVLAQRQAAEADMKRLQAEFDRELKTFQAREQQFKSATQEQQRQLENQWKVEKAQRQAELDRIRAAGQEAERKWRMAQADKKQEAEIAYKLTAFADEREERQFKRQEAALALRSKIDLARQQFEFDREMRLANQAMSQAEGQRKYELQAQLQKTKHAFEERFRTSKQVHEQSLQDLREEENRRRNRFIEEQKIRVLDMAQVDQRFKQQLALEMQKVRAEAEEEKRRLAQARFDLDLEMKRENLKLAQRRQDMLEVTKNRELEYKKTIDQRKLELDDQKQRALQEHTAKMAALKQQVDEKKLDLAQFKAQQDMELKRINQEFQQRFKQEEAQNKLELARFKAEGELKLKEAELQLKKTERQRKKGFLRLKKGPETTEDQPMDGESLSDPNRSEVDSLVGSDAFTEKTSVDAKEFRAYEDFYSSVRKHLYVNRKELLNIENKPFVLLTVDESVLNGAVKRAALQTIDIMTDYSKLIRYMGFAKMVYDLDISVDKKQFVETLVQLARTGLAPDLIRRVGLLVDQVGDNAAVPSLADIARALSVVRISPDVVAGVAKLLAQNKLTPEALLDSKAVLDSRLRQERQIKDLEDQLEAEKKHSLMMNEYQQAFDRLNDQDKKQAEAAILVLRDSNFLSRITLFRDMAIWMSRQSAPVKSPEDLWALIQRYNDIRSELELARNENNVRADLRDLLKLLDDNLLQPKTTLQLLRSLLSDPDTVSLGGVIDTIRQLKQRNSELSSSFRLTLVAMGSLLQIFNSVSRRYAFHVLEFVRGFSAKVVATTQAWGLPANNPVAQLADQLADTFAKNYYVEVKVDQKTDIRTLELTFNGQNVDLTTDAVFLRSASLFRWLDQFIVDPKRPTDVDMAKLWDQAAEHLYDWQQQVITTFGKTDVAGPSRPVDAITNGLLSANSQFFSRVDDALSKTTKIAQSALDRFGKDMKTQDDSLRRRVEYLLVSPALGEYTLTINGQDAKTQEAARAIFRAFIDATRNQLLDGKQDGLDSTKIMADINRLANGMQQLELEAKAKDGEHKRLESEHKKLQTEHKTTQKELADVKSDVATAITELQKYAPYVNASVVGNLPKDVVRVLDVYEKARQDYEATKQEVKAVVGELNLVGIQVSTVLARDMLETLKQLKTAYKNYEKLVADENTWWDLLRNVRYPITRGRTVEEIKEITDESKNLSSITNDTLRLLAERRAIVTKWVASIADLVKDNDLLTVKDLINKAQGKPSSKGSASASTTPAAAHADPYYRVKFNGEVDTLKTGDMFPVFLPQTPFMRLWMFAREFAGAASNQLGNILEPLAPGLEIDDERTLLILRQYQTESKTKKPEDLVNPTLPTGASRTEVAKQQLADDEEKKDLKETAEERRKYQKDSAFDYIGQLDKYENLDKYEIKVRQYFKNIALNALVHCQEMLQRTDLPEFRRITLAELINSAHLSSGFARMCGLYILIKQGTVPGMISTQSSEANRARDFLNHARDLPRMYRRKGPYVWEVVRVPSSNGDSSNNKRLRL